MKESSLYINFIKRNFLILFIPLFVGILISSFLLAQAKNQTRISQSFKMIYNLEDLNSALALTDQAVAELRAQSFSSLYPEASDTIYKSGPLLINIEAAADQKEAAYELLIKLTTYLSQNFSALQINQPEISMVEPDVAKYLLSGALIGFLLGLVTSLIKEYLKNY